jgi:hypothetical protein
LVAIKFRDPINLILRIASFGTMLGLMTLLLSCARSHTFVFIGGSPQPAVSISQ